MTADERIAKLLERAGSMAMVVKNSQENDEEKRKRATKTIDWMLLEKFHGNIADYIVYLVDTIDRMETVLLNVVDERDQLISDIKKLSHDTYGCDTCSRYVCGCCKHNSNYAVCKNCNLENDSWEWRGVLNDNSISERKD